MRLHFIFLAAALLSNAALAGPCANTIGQCGYYVCKEAENRCGDDGYFINFGLKYCERYQEVEPSFTTQGQRFLDNVRTCLQVKLENPGRKYSCGSVESYAVNTHFDCYMQAGYCRLPASDRLSVAAVGSDLIFNWRIVLLYDRLKLACLL